MIRVDSSTKTAYKTDGIHKSLEIRIPGKNIVLTNTNLISQSLSLTETIESTQNLSFTGCNAAVLKFKCVDIIEELEGEYIEADITASDTETIPLFRGYIDKTTNPSHEQQTMEITAYDALYSKINNIDVTSWYNNLTFPITIKNLRDSFFSYLGIEQKPDYLPNDPIAVTKTFDSNIIKGSDIIKAICQINGRFGRIGRTGIFEYVYLTIGTEALYPRDDLYPAEDLYPSAENAIDNISKAHYKSIEFENYRVNPIDKVQLVNKSGTIIKTVGTGHNAFTLKNNPLVWGLNDSQLNTVATNLYNTVQGLWYTPATVSCVGLPYVECGDFVMMSAKRAIIRAYVLNRTLTGIQALSDNFKAVGDKNQPIYVPTLETKIAANTQAINTETSRAQEAERNEASVRQSQINNEASTRQNQVDSVNIRCDNLQASKASIDQLNATNANVNNLSARVANIDNLVATKASISQLNASIANVNTLIAQKASIEQLNARFAGGYAASFTSLTCQSIRLAGKYIGGTVRITTSNGHGYDVAGVQVY